ncbi:TctC [Variovorax sp. Root318D1]|uniref:Bug family tripartite tricarboxylate transporter substrate binding protein n=1 Tax=Variovorax sp. Root318D1 TaxID=1736513 RepID=UPI0006F8342A|nr:TctC [Variovorax sp. Root318D1]
MKTPTIFSRRTALLAAACLLPGAAAFAQEPQFPTRPVRIISPFPVGSGPDGVARLVADKLARAWGQPVTVDNKPGGNGFIAINAFKRGATDGHDLIHLENVHLTAYPHLFKKLPFDGNKDFELIAPVFKTYFFITVSADSKYRNVADLVADAKANPGRLSYGSWSVGNPAHLGSALLETMTGTQMQHVVYKETNQLYGGVANGELNFALGTIATAGPLYRGGKLKFLAIAAPRRLAAYKDVPTVAEAGGPAGFEVSGWTAFAAPRGVSPAVLEKIRRDVAKALSEQDVRDKFAAFGYEPFMATPAEFAKHISAESSRFADVIKKVGAHLD